MATAQETFTDLRERFLKPALKDGGFRSRARNTWLMGDPDAGWIVVNVGGNRRNSRERGEWSVVIWGWPPGTWEWETRRDEVKDTKPDSRVAPLYAGPDSVLGFVDGTRPDAVELVAGMDIRELADAARVLLDYIDVACRWVEGIFESGRADAHTREAYVLGAAEMTGRWTPVRRELLDTLTARAQRGAGSPDWEDLRRWRLQADLPAAPLPGWYHPLMKAQPPANRFASPRAAFVAGHGRSVEVRAQDGSRWLPRAEDFPDDRTIASWRKEASVIPEGTVMLLPDWLPWIEWLNAAPDGASPLRSWRQRFKSKHS